MNSETSGETSGEKTRIALRTLGEDLVLSVPAADEELVRGQWARCLAPNEPDGSDGSDGPRVLSADLDPRASADSWQYALTSEVTLAALAGLGGRLNLHAAGVAAPDGRVLALVGPSGRGKTTAAAHLGARFGYVTDECVSIDLDDLSVLPYPKPLSVVVDPAVPGAKVQCGPDELDLLPAPQPLRLHGLVLLDRDPDGTDPDGPAVLETMDPIEGLLELIPQTSRLLSLERPLAGLAAAIGRLGGVHRIRYAEAAQLDAPVQALFDALPGDPGEQEPGVDLLDGVRRGPAYDPAGGTPPDPAPGSGPASSEEERAAEAELVDPATRVVRLEPRDAVGYGAEFVVLYGSLPHHLGVLPTLVWEYAGEPIRLDDLHAIAETELGENPDSLGLLLLTAQTLIQHGCLRRVLSD